MLRLQMKIPNIIIVGSSNFQRGYLRSGGAGGGGREGRKVLGVSPGKWGWKGWNY